MNEYESITEENDTNYEEHDQEMKGNDEPFPVIETITITKIS